MAHWEKIKDRRNAASVKLELQVDCLVGIEAFSIAGEVNIRTKGNIGSY